MSNFFEAAARDVLLARQGDADAIARLARRGIPWVAKRILPGAAAPIVDMAAGAYDVLAKPEIRVPADGNYSTPGSSKFARWLSTEFKYGLIVIIGGGGGGKTATLCAISERIKHTASAMYFVGAPAAVLHGTPFKAFDWPLGERGESPKERAARQNRVANRLERLRPGSVLVLPDAGLYLDSHSQDDKAEEAIRWLATIARHRKLRFLVDVQYSRLISVSALGGSLKALLYKPLGVTGNLIEREEMRKLSRVSEEAFLAVPPEERRKYVYVYADEADFRGLSKVTLPKWYSAELSESHSLDADALGVVDAPEVIDAEWDPASKSYRAKANR